MKTQVYIFPIKNYNKSLPEAKLRMIRSVFRKYRGAEIIPKIKARRHGHGRNFGALCDILILRLIFCSLPLVFCEHSTLHFHFIIHSFGNYYVCGQRRKRSGFVGLFDYFGDAITGKGNSCVDTVAGGTGTNGIINNQVLQKLNRTCASISDIYVRRVQQN